MIILFFVIIFYKLILYDYSFFVIINYKLILYDYSFLLLYDIN